MTDTFITLDETEAFLSANPNVTWIDLIVFDINGIPRGKRFRRDDLPGVAKNGVMMPSTVFVMDARGNCVEETGRLWETGDPDVPFRILWARCVPYRPAPAATRKPSSRSNSPRTSIRAASSPAKSRRSKRPVRRRSPPSSSSST